MSRSSCWRSRGWRYTEHRQRRFGPTPSDDIFRCESCGYVYTDDLPMWIARAANSAER
jgi:hypothetical protein